MGARFFVYNRRMPESSFLNPGKTLAAAHLYEGMTVADFGCGAGFFARAAARLVGARGVVWAVDAHRELLPRLKNLALGEGLQNVEVMHGNIERAGGSRLPDARADLVIAANVLFSAERKETLAREAARVLKKGGRALIVDWQGSFGGLGPHPSHVVGEAAGRRVFEDAGFVFVNNVPAGAFHWGVILKKK